MDDHGVPYRISNRFRANRDPVSLRVPCTPARLPSDLGGERGRGTLRAVRPAPDDNLHLHRGTPQRQRSRPDSASGWAFAIKSESPRSFRIAGAASWSPSSFSAPSPTPSLPGAPGPLSAESLRLFLPEGESPGSLLSSNSGSWSSCSPSPDPSSPIPNPAPMSTSARRDAQMRAGRRHSAGRRSLGVLLTTRTRLLPQVNIWGGLKSVQLQFSRESFFGTPRTGHTLAGSSHGYGYERAQSQQLIPTRKDHESGGLRHSPPRSLQVRGRASRPLTAPGLCGVDPARLREVSAGQRQLREAGAAASLCDRWGPRRRPGRIPAPEPGGARGDPPGDPGCPI